MRRIVKYETDLTPLREYGSNHDLEFEYIVESNRLFGLIPFFWHPSIFWHGRCGVYECPRLVMKARFYSYRRAEEFIVRVNNYKRVGVVENMNN